MVFIKEMGGLERLGWFPKFYLVLSLEVSPYGVWTLDAVAHSNFASTSLDTKNTLLTKLMLSNLITYNCQTILHW